MGRRGIRRTGRFDEPEDPDEELDEAAALDTTTSLDQLASAADPETFDETYAVTKSDLPVGTGSALPTPFPIQGIPRLAYVLNFNYVWDEKQGEWVKKKAGTDGTREEGNIIISDPGIGLIGVVVRVGEIDSTATSNKPDVTTEATNANITSSVSVV